MKRPSNITLFSGYLMTLAELPKGIPSGHLYAMSMSVGVGLAQHLQVVSVLRKSGMVTESDHLLTITEHGQNTAKKLAAVIPA